MDNYDEGYLRIAEEKLEKIYNLALERARKAVPEAAYVIDPRTMDDYLKSVGLSRSLVCKLYASGWF